MLRISTTRFYSISPRYICLSLDPEAIIVSFGWKSTSLTLPLWPGSLYKILRDVVSQMYMNRSAEPALTLLPSADQEQRSRFFSKLCWCPRTAKTIFYIHTDKKNKFLHIYLPEFLKTKFTKFAKLKIRYFASQLKIKIIIKFSK